MLKHYDEVCNHCGKDIHPPKNRLGDPVQSMVDTTADCIWVERHQMRGQLMHPWTNYICLDCATELDAWLRTASYR